MKREEMIKRYEDIVLNIHGKAGDEERADYILALCRITQLICQLYQPEQDTKWQKLKEFIIKKQEEYQADIIEQEMQGSIPNSISFYARYNLCNEIQKKIQELEAEAEDE